VSLAQLIGLELDGWRLLLSQADGRRALLLSLAAHGAGEGKGGGRPPHLLNKKALESASAHENAGSKWSEQLGRKRMDSSEQQPPARLRSTGLS